MLFRESTYHDLRKWTFLRIHFQIKFPRQNINFHCFLIGYIRDWFIFAVEGGANLRTIEVNSQK